MPDRISKKQNRADMKSDIVQCAAKNKYVATDEIADRISARASYSWTREALRKTLEEIIAVNGSIREYKILLKSDDKRRDVFVDELNSLKGMKIS